MCGATVATKGDETLDASATGERGAGTNSGVSIARLTTGPLVGLLASRPCSTKLPDGAIAKTPTPNPARIKANPTTLLMTNHLHHHLRAPRDDLAHSDQAGRQRVRHALAKALMLNAGATPLSEAGTRSGYEGSSLRPRSVRNVCALSYQRPSRDS